MSYPTNDQPRAYRSSPYGGAGNDSRNPSGNGSSSPRPHPQLQQQQQHYSAAPDFPPPPPLPYNHQHQYSSSASSISTHGAPAPPPTPGRRYDAHAGMAPAPPLPSTPPIPGYHDDSFDQTPRSGPAPGFHIGHGHSPYSAPFHRTQSSIGSGAGGPPYASASAYGDVSLNDGMDFASSQAHLVPSTGPVHESSAAFPFAGMRMHDGSPSPGHMQEHQHEQLGATPMGAYSSSSGASGSQQYDEKASAHSSYLHQNQKQGVGFEAIEMTDHQQHHQQQQLGYDYGPQPPYPPTPFSGAGPLHMPNPMDPTPADVHFPGAPGAMIAPGAQSDARFGHFPGQYGAGAYGPGPGPAGGVGAGAYPETRERLLRKRTVKHIELTNGNLVLEVPVPRSISSAQNASAEFRQMRYQAVTCDPDAFVRERYALRPFLYGRRQIELMVCMTMYNEDAELFVRTMNGVIKNIVHFTSREKSKTWGRDSWKKIVVVVVSDGRKKANADTLKVLGLMGCYSEAVMLDHVGEKATTSHVFEYTTQVVVGADGTVQVGSCPVQVIFCLKEQNQKKINSHRWFFSAFCQQLQPNVCILLDVGTKPAPTALYDLWKVFDKHPKCGGACGEIRVDAGKGQWQLINPLVASQNFEYKTSNILDKPLESVFGYISVLPGAFSAYRYKALQGAPLNAYFKGEALHSGSAVNAGTFESNMYLAEDRILCFELVTKKNEAWTLRYVKSSHAATDVPQQVPEFISQRRRWLNGSLFAAIYSLVHFHRIFTSGHGPFRKLLLFIQAIYNLAQLIFTYTAISCFFLAFYFLVSSATSDPAHDPFGGQGAAVLEVIQNTLIALMVICLVCSLGNRPQGSKFAYTTVIILFAGIMILGLYCAGWTTYLALRAAGLTHLNGWTGANVLQMLQTSGFRDIVISLAATYVLWLVAAIVFLDPWHMLTSFWAYMLLVPTYTIVLAVYSMSNLHDVSWGTKGSDKAHTDLGTAAKTKKDGKEVVRVKVPTTSDEAEALWASMQRDLATPKPKGANDAPSRSADQKQQDHYSNFRTNFLLIWVAVNAAMILIFTSTWFNAYIVRKHRASGNQGPVVNPFQSAVFYAMAGFSAVRFVGCLAYVIFFRILGL